METLATIQRNKTMRRRRNPELNQSILSEQEEYTISEISVVVRDNATVSIPTQQKSEESTVKRNASVTGNSHLKESTISGAAKVHSSYIEYSTVSGNADVMDAEIYDSYILGKAERGAVVRDSYVGPNATVHAGAVLEGYIFENGTWGGVADSDDPLDEPDWDAMNRFPNDAYIHDHETYRKYISGFAGGPRLNPRRRRRLKRSY